MTAPTCDMVADCQEPLTHLDENGSVYCYQHGVQRQRSGWKRCRKMRPYEINRIYAGKQIERY